MTSNALSNVKCYNFLFILILHCINYILLLINRV